MMRSTMADTDAVQRGRYQLNDLSLYPSDAGTSLEIDSGAVGVGSFDEDNLDSQLSAELRRRWRRRVAKFVAATVAAVALLALLASSGRRRGGTEAGARTRQPPASGGNGGGGDGGGPRASPEPETVADGLDKIAAEVLHARTADPPFEVCPPPAAGDRQGTQSDLAVYHLDEFRIIPEDESTDATDRWVYTLSDMDVSDDSSIIALGLGDYAADSGYAVGMVRVFAYSCQDKEFKRLGQDLVGEHDREMFGHRVSSNRDGTILAISAPQGGYSGGTGFVEVYTIDNDPSTKGSTGRWIRMGSKIDALPDAEEDVYMLGHAVDVSDGGRTLAALGIVDGYTDGVDDDGLPGDGPTYVTRVFDYDYRKKEWLREYLRLRVSHESTD